MPETPNQFAKFIQSGISLARKSKEAVSPYIPQCIKSIRFTVKNSIIAAAIGASVIAGTAAAVNNCSGKKENPGSLAGNKREVIDNLTAKYGHKSAQFALQVIRNGQRIKASSQKSLELQKLKDEIRKEYPDISPIKLFGYCDETREAEQIAMLHNAREQISEAKTTYKHYLPIGFIMAALSNEGFSLDLDHPNNANNSGFANFGNDTFGSEFEKIVKAGFIGADFKSQFTPSTAVNEHGQKVISANFKNKRAAIRAFVAMLGYNQYMFFEDLRKKNIPADNLSADEKLFFTYYYYNRGPNSIDEILNSEKDIHHFFNEKKNVGARATAYRVVTGAKWLKSSGALDIQPEGKYFWSKPEVKSEKPNAPKKHSIEYGDLDVPSYAFDKARVTRPWLWLLQTARAEGWNGQLDDEVKGLRSFQQQMQLFIAYQNGTGSPAFNPAGPNAHKASHMAKNVKKRGPWSMAIDTTPESIPSLIKIAAKHGIKLYKPYIKETWHVEAVDPFEEPKDWNP